MALVPIEDVGSVGIIKDPPPYAIPPNAWSDGSNVQFSDNGVQNIEGYFEVMKDCPILVKHLVCYSRVDKPDFWIAFGAEDSLSNLVGKVYCFGQSDEQVELNEPPSWVNVTPSTGIGNNSSVTWSDTFLGAQLIVSNGIDDMIYWPLDEDDGVVKKDTLFEKLPMDLSDDITEWESERGGPRPETINTFKSILIGMNWPSDPTRVWWSSPGGHYTLPTWDYYNNDMDAGDYELNDTRGAIVDGASLGEAFVIYKEDSIYLASYIGRPFIFAFKALTMDVGLLTKNALEPFPGGHLFMSKHDVHITNGQTVTSLLSDKLQGELFNNISGEYYHNAFISSDKTKNEAYICWPTANNEWCDRCIIWNWVTGTFSVRDIPNISDIEQGTVAWTTEFDSWDEAFYIWDAATRPWGQGEFDSVHPELVFPSPIDDMIRRNSSGLHTIDGGVMPAYVERTGLDLGDPASVKKVNAIWPRIATTGDTTVNISVCSQMSPDDVVKWEGPYEFNPNTQSKVSCRATGKYFGWKIESNGYLRWRCHGVGFNVEQAGSRGGRIQ